MKQKRYNFVWLFNRFSLSQLPSGCEHLFVCRGQQTTARGGCNVCHQHDKISMKNSKCAISVWNNQNGGPDRYEHMNKKRDHAKTEQRREHVENYQKKNAREN